MDSKKVGRFFGHSVYDDDDDDDDDGSNTDPGQTLRDPLPSAGRSGSWSRRVLRVTMLRSRCLGPSASDLRGGSGSLSATSLSTWRSPSCSVCDVTTGSFRWRRRDVSSSRWKTVDVTVRLAMTAACSVLWCGPCCCCACCLVFFVSSVRVSDKLLLESPTRLFLRRLLRLIDDAQHLHCTATSLVDWWRSVAVMHFIWSMKLLYAGSGYYLDEWLPTSK